jgi:hypothetical protein
MKKKYIKRKCKCGNRIGLSDVEFCCIPCQRGYKKHTLYCDKETGKEIKKFNEAILKMDTSKLKGIRWE